MDVMFTTHPKDGPGKYYMVVAEEREWADILRDLGRPHVEYGLSLATEKMVSDLEGWGIEP